MNTPVTPVTLNLPDGPPLPEMREAVLTGDDLAALINDLTTFTRITSVIGKGGTRTNSTAEPLTLSAAVEQLVSRTLPAVQVRYQYDGHDWTDTLMQTPQGIRMVRCQHPLTTH